MIDATHELPIVRQAQLLDLARSTVYYQPQPMADADLALMRRIDELHLEHPFAGSRMLRDLLNREGVAVGRKHVATLMRRMASRHSISDRGHAAGIASIPFPVSAARRHHRPAQQVWRWTRPTSRCAALRVPDRGARLGERGSWRGDCRSAWPPMPPSRRWRKPSPTTACRRS